MKWTEIYLYSTSGERTLCHRIRINEMNLTVWRDSINGFWMMTFPPVADSPVAVLPITQNLGCAKDEAQELAVLFLEDRILNFKETINEIRKVQNDV